MVVNNLHEGQTMKRMTMTNDLTMETVLDNVNSAGGVVLTEDGVDVAVIVKPADLSGAALEHLLASFDDDLTELLAGLDPTAERGPPPPPLTGLTNPHIQRLCNDPGRRWATATVRFAVHRHAALSRRLPTNGNGCAAWLVR